MSAINANNPLNKIKGLFTNGTKGLVSRATANSIARRTSAANGIVSGVRNIEMSGNTAKLNLLPLKKKADRLYDSVGALESSYGGKGQAGRFVKTTGVNAIGSMAEEYFTGSNLTAAEKATRAGAAGLGAVGAVGLIAGGIGRATSPIGDLTHDSAGRRDVYGVPFI